ncbi:hypothetical protein Q5P01_009121 [Channa striata]|uniref:MmgE/PrpD N-terminal domain-containing protein n=1 Tax=Channa striata TaxID=64152 RepID=A0AA88STC2_CHASR|nr:hypothetical protein Q5P01_009121 [Channa striata]
MDTLAATFYGFTALLKFAEGYSALLSFYSIQPVSPVPFPVVFSVLFFILALFSCQKNLLEGLHQLFFAAYCVAIAAQPQGFFQGGTQGVQAAIFVVSAGMFLITTFNMTHSVDFDDTWHLTTRPSGAVPPAVQALSDMMPANTGLDFLLAFNVSTEIQDRLMRFSNDACNIPRGAVLPALLALSDGKPSGLDFLLAFSVRIEIQGRLMSFSNDAFRMGIRNNLQSIQRPDYVPQPLESPSGNDHMFLLEEQDMAFKRFPAHLGMHWVADAAASVHELLVGAGPGTVSPAQVQDILLLVPKSKYIKIPHL